MLIHANNSYSNEYEHIITNYKTRIAMAEKKFINYNIVIIYDKLVLVFI